MANRAGVVHGVHEYRVESSKNASISTYRAVRLLGLKEAMIFPVSNGGPTLTTRTDGEMMEMAQSLQILRVSTELLGLRI